MGGPRGASVLPYGNAGMGEKPEGKVAARCEGPRVCQSEETGFYLDVQHGRPR